METLREYQSGRFTVHAVDDDVVTQALESLLPNPDLLLESGQRLKGRGNRCLAAKIDLCGTSLVLKRYDARGLWYGFRHMFKASRARRVWTNSWHFLAAGTSVPRPWACLEERIGGLLGRAYVLSGYMNEAVTFDQLWPKLDENARREWVAYFGDFYGRLHRAGGIHGDTNWDNIMVPTGTGSFDATLIDFDCSRWTGRFSIRRAERDIQHFLRDLKRLGGDETMADLFVSSWKERTGQLLPRA